MFLVNIFRGKRMRKLLILIAALSCAAVITVAGSANFSLQEIPKESKTQPKEVVLDKDSQSDKYGDVAFNHENHATKMYSIDGKTVISCVECHHTDQPPAALKAPLKTSEREVALTADAARGRRLEASQDLSRLPPASRRRQRHDSHRHLRRTNRRRRS